MHAGIAGARDGAGFSFTGDYIVWKEFILMLFLFNDKVADVYTATWLMAFLM